MEVPDLYAALDALLVQIPAGRVSTFGTLAMALGHRTAAPWIGHHVLHHEHRPDCNCHRVVTVDGKVGGYVAGGPRAKARRLASEGIRVRHGCADVARHRFDEFASERPLEKLLQAQHQLARRVSLRSPRRAPRYVAGVDVSYRTAQRETIGVGAYALWDLDREALVWQTTVDRVIRFPYISSFLAFRELPVHFDLIAAARQADRMADILLVDGSGILHPRLAGIATQLGVAIDHPTVGVTKKLLCGTLITPGGPSTGCRVEMDSRIVGAAIFPTASTRKPIYVSPGHRINVDASDRLVSSLLLGHRLPEPLYWADRLSRARAKDQGVVAIGATRVTHAPPAWQQGEC